jgi:DNA-directed RNA polymerase subunit RPC12/RpoP
MVKKKNQYRNLKKQRKKKIKKYKCKTCGMEFFSLSRKLLKKENKGLTCPYCESELWKSVVTKLSLVFN